MNEVRFRREAFRGDFQNQQPKWHIIDGPYWGPTGLFTGLCGYERNGILGNISVSTAKKRPPKQYMCKKCVDPAEASGH